MPTLGHDFHSTITIIQWVPTVYLLAFACVIPLTGWASERFGAKRVWLASLAVFMLGSLLAGFAPSIGVLIAFRVIQGLGGGMIMPLGQMILVRAAGPQRMGRVMSIVGIPMLLAPIFGPVLGGAIVGGASWRWIFLVNLPVGAIAIALAIRLLPNVPPQRGAHLDTLGLVLLSGGLAPFLYGLARIGSENSLADPMSLAALLAGLTLMTSFVRHALRTDDPLIDVRLFANRNFAAAAATNLLLGIALFGVALLLPLYLQIVRGRDPLETGLLLIPQGLGAACAMPIAGVLTDRVGARRVVIAGVCLGLLGTGAYTQIATNSPYWYLAGALFAIGAGLGATITPSMAVGYQAVTGKDIPRATSALNVIQRVAGSLGTTLLAVVLQRSIDAEIPTFHGGLAQAGALARLDPSRTLPALTHAFGTTFWVALGLTAAALVPALLLPSAVRRNEKPEEAREARHLRG